jgi:hypothetical protein
MRLVTTNDLADGANVRTFPDAAVGDRADLRHPFEPILLTADQVPVLHMEGLMHGFLALRTLEGTRLADGEMRPPRFSACGGLAESPSVGSRRRLH